MNQSPLHTEAARDHAPRGSLIEQTLVEIWNTILGRTEVAPTDNFFEIGGDSLLALVAIEQVNQRLGWKLNLSDLLRYPSVRALAANKALLQAANTERTIVRMSNRGARTPILFIHPVGGLVFAYAKLVHHLGNDRGCYGIQSPILSSSTELGASGVPGGPTGPDTIEAIAEQYADLIADEFGEDDFHLVGWSAGGVIAAEVARLASGRGLGLQKLVLIDSYVWMTLPFDASEDATLREFRADLLAQIAPHAHDDRTAPLHASPAVLFRELAAALFGAEAQRAGDFGAQFVQRLYAAYRVSFRALAAYRPTPGPVAALLLHAEDNDTLETWRSVLRGALTTELVGGGHYGLLGEPDAATIAAKIEAYCTAER